MIFKSFQLSGVGLHSGQNTTVKILPAETGGGRYFVRVDLPEQPVIPANIDSVVSTTLSTELARGEAKVRTVEHLLAALVGCGIEDARLEIDGVEVPLLDGSAKLWVEGIQEAKVKPTPNPSQEGNGQKAKDNGGLSIEEPIWVGEGDAFVAALPSRETRFTYGIDFPYPAIGHQWHSWNPQQERFEEAIAPARTFGFADQIEQLRSAGLIKGGSLDNALVCDRTGWLNPPLRFDNEPVRHKLLDLVGDLSLLEVIPQAHFLAYKASHKLHIELVKKIMNYEL